jgi:uridine kinase
VIDRIVKRDGRVVPFNRDKITFAVLSAAVAVGGRDRAAAERVTDDAIRLLEQRAGPDSIPTVEEVQDLVEKALIERGHARTAKAYILYRYEHALKRAGQRSLTYSADNIPYEKLWEALSWAVDHGSVRLAEIAAAVREGRFAELVRAGEEFYARELDAAAQSIRERIRLQELRLVIVAGPSSSGKTTTTIKIEERLAADGSSFVPINVDNFFLDLAEHPRDPRGDYDFETPQALDMARIGDALGRLLEGERVELPFYNFKSGRREGSSGTLQLKPGQILLIDSLHGLHPEMTESIPDERKFRLYIETLSQLKDSGGQFLRWADVRLLRRMVRDMQFRNYSPAQTIQHWHLVRRSELRYIVPRLSQADAIVNSFLPFELPIMKHRLGGLFPDFIQRFGADPERSDALERARRIHQMFEELPPWSDESVIPADSLLREFIGGSRYKY